MGLAEPLDGGRALPAPPQVLAQLEARRRPGLAHVAPAAALDDLVGPEGEPTVGPLATQWRRAAT
ncbi:MAG: hypothetical protein M3137_05775 [Actinomycetota bacterium]|nr:hypothetical protein [Actinomycetota bacterium]